MPHGHSQHSNTGAKATDACSALLQAVRAEPYATKMGIRAVEVEPGRSHVEMRVSPDMLNIFGITHGGAVFSVIDEAFQLACNAHGTIAYALNLSVTYVRSSLPGDLLVARASEVASTKRTATYAIRVTDERGETVAVAQALAYRKGDPLPFLETP